MEIVENWDQLELGIGMLDIDDRYALISLDVSTSIVQKTAMIGVPTLAMSLDQLVLGK